MLRKLNLFFLFYIAAAPIYAQLPSIKVPINNHANNAPFYSQQKYYKEAPQISSVRVLTVTSTSSRTEFIGDGQMGTVNHHSETVIIQTLEIGYAHYITATMNGARLSDSDDKRALCADEHGALRECRGGESAVAFMRTWTIRNLSNGPFSYQATSTNPPYHKESVRLLIN